MSDQQKKTRKTSNANHVLHKHGVDYVIVFDCEMSGPNPRNFFMFELAATLWRLGDKEPLDELYFYFGLDGPWDARTVREMWDNTAHGSDGKTPLMLLRERVAREGTPKTTEGQAAVKLTSWAREWYKKTDGKILCVTDTPGFDYQFITHMLASITTLPTGEQPPHSLNYLFGEYQPVCDIDSFYMGVGCSLQKWSSCDKMIQKYDMLYPDWVAAYKHNHDPRSDARSIAAKLSCLFEKE